MMGLDRLKPELQRIFTIAVPAAVLLFAAFLVAPKAVYILSANRQVAALRKEAALRRRQNMRELAAVGAQHLPAALQTRDEPLAFLRQLNQMLAGSRVRLVSYRPPSETGGARPAGASAGSDSSARPADPGAGSDSAIKPIGCEVTVSGSFEDLVRLFRTLARDERLFTVENLQVKTETYPRLSAGFHLVRYVTPVSVGMARAQGAAMVRTASAWAGERTPSVH